jgi:hypothetical protein
MFFFKRSGETEQEDDSLLIDDAKCNTTEWTPVSECSVSCGIGFMFRTRQFLDHTSYKKCRHIGLVMKKKCMQPACTKVAEQVILNIIEIYTKHSNFLKEQY